MVDREPFDLALDEFFGELDDIARAENFGRSEFLPLVQVYFGKHIANLYSDWVMDTWEPIYETEKEAV